MHTMHTPLADLGTLTLLTTPCQVAGLLRRKVLTQFVLQVGLVVGVEELRIVAEEGNLRRLRRHLTEGAHDTARHKTTYERTSSRQFNHTNYKQYATHLESMQHN